MQLLAGNNTLTFMRSTEASAPIAIKEFFLYITKPDIPAPATNYVSLARPSQNDPARPLK